ncbi:hypothetical protein GQ53DRAFT_346651 [Thozetella sp. PMI_491]|nr:hypothetical protein GQ53DRAFT_346651 [Thozetella sp. PMI_491]
MATVTTSALGRTRSTRAPAAANSSKALQPPATRTAAASGTIASGPSHVFLFLTNLRLLDLDLHPEWPDITALTFSSKDAAQGQKRRIQCVEWALYQLFALWDPEETRNKLRPFFPPLDQVQSLNLRAALLRGLEQAKKNGVLGRDAVIRKTMLDECKGERLEEVLAVFSSAVLKRLVAEQPESRAPLAQSMALEDRGYTGDRTQLAALIVAHKASLGRGLKEKQSAGERFHDFAELLRLKERSLLRRKEQLREQPGEGSENTRLDTWRTVRNNWSGNERWMEALLYGDSGGRQDGLLSAPFDRVWRRVEAGRLGELEDQTGGLIEQLDGRVRAQRDRLEKWQRFRHQVLSQKGSEAAVAPKDQERGKGIDLGFGAHENLQLGRLSPKKLQRKTELPREYSELLRGLEDELASIDQGPRRRSSLLRPRLAVESREATPEGAISELEDYSAETSLDEGSRAPARSGGKPSIEPPDLVGPSAALKSSVAPGSKSLPTEPSVEHVPPVPPVPRVRQGMREQAPEVAMARPSTPSSPEASPTQQMADQILASMNEASPSPVKKPRHTLSLAERTRLSMARRGSQMKLEEDEPDLLSLRRGPSIAVEPAEPADPLEPEEDSLLARTRRSMAGFEAAQLRAQLQRRRSERKSKAATAPKRDDSYFPTLDEEEGNSSLMLAEELITTGQEYDKVFMSRPKLKTSPLGTPVKESHE